MDVHMKLPVYALWLMPIYVNYWCIFYILTTVFSQVENVYRVVRTEYLYERDRVLLKGLNL